MPKVTKGQHQSTLRGWVTPGREAPSPSSENRRSTRIKSNIKRKELIDRGRIDTPQRRSLLEVAQETKEALPGILNQIPNIRAGKSVAYFSETLNRLDAARCPRRTPSGKAKIRVVNDDTFNAAAMLAAARPQGGRVAVLNMANATIPGGGWDRGAMAQEEELCYRSSLHLALPRRHYPWTETQALYAPDVVVFRGDFASGHRMMMEAEPGLRPVDLPIVGVLSVAAVQDPRIKRVRVRGRVKAQVEVEVEAKVKRRGEEGEGQGQGQGQEGKEEEEEEEEQEELRYRDPATREQAKEKMRLTLRMAAHNDHGLLVLGALGCGAFRNPKHDVARCWLEVLREREFAGGWWEEVWFAVFDRRREGNFELFESLLGGEEV